jgi:group I intron endonuclease
MMTPEPFSIYMIRNTVNDKVYIGETIHLAEMRLAVHKRRLELGVHEKPVLQAEWNRFGADAFEFSVLRYYREKSVLGARRRVEREWMDRLQSTHPNYGYNTRVGGPRLQERSI